MVGDHRAALPEFEAPAGLNDVLDIVRARRRRRERERGGAASRHRHAAARAGRTADAFAVPDPLHADLCLVFGPDDELTAEVAETLAVIRLDLDGDGPGCPA
ncbi:hypothetical protein [Streptomyces sp. NRRL S-1022]|uniref:hypothetical protein n=1 Tax=Streptomyces sp. NRRL S-1022 TaxID=1463880 RepID=UPI0018FE1FD0|nr:hypothetical protein [Streptomyces sp. NRRL S-1022]